MGVGVVDVLLPNWRTLTFVTSVPFLLAFALFWFFSPFYRLIYDVVQAYSTLPALTSGSGEIHAGG